jgi:Xaa-Pro aminopeptidase
MIKDINNEMRHRDIGAIVVLGDTTLGNPDLSYAVGGNLARGGIYFKRVDNDPLLLTSTLDFHTAQRLGRVRTIRTFTDYNFERLMVDHGRTEAYPRLIVKVLRELGVTGKVALAGRNDLGWGIYLSDRLRALGAEITGEDAPTIIEAARETKSAGELDEIRIIGNKTAHVVNVVMDKLREAKRRRGHLWVGRSRATVGVVKQIIALQLASEHLTAPEGTIFAIGASSADPHNSGDPRAEITEGKLIVFDIFPQSESGYWFDLTRSFTVGRAPKRALQLYDTVRRAQAVALDLLKEGLPGDEAMSRACDIIEGDGFRTVRDIYQGKAQQIHSGFNHSLGHGVGLTIGERPYLSFQSKDPLKNGHVVTVEPGVYLPRYGGVRIEDTVHVTGRGCVNLSTLRKEFELT